jgi:polyribonucleotide nucleotidyltransferase
MDAGVPIVRAVAGISVGLVAQGAEHVLLTDIQGPEDHMGDMDCKVAGTTEGITAIQMDVKLRGITPAIFAEALEAARQARLAILDSAILSTLSAPRAELSEWAPRIHILHISPDKIGELIGPGGKVIRQIIEECEVEIDVEDDGTVFVTAERPESAAKALEWISGITREIKVGEVFEGVVKKVVAFGAFVEISPGQEGLVHISELADKRIEKVEDVLKHGDTIVVKVIGIDEQGKIRLSVKQAKA